MPDRRPDFGRYVMAAFVVVLFVVLAYYLLQQIPHAQRPTLHPTTTTSPR